MSTSEPSANTTTTHVLPRPQTGRPCPACGYCPCCGRYVAGWPWLGYYPPVSIPSVWGGPLPYTITYTINTEVK